MVKEIRILLLILSVLFCFNIVFAADAVPANGSFRIDDAQMIDPGVLYYDKITGTQNYLFYKIHVPADSKIKFTFDIEQGSHSQGIDYSLLATRSSSSSIYHNSFFGKGSQETFFRDSFDIPAGDYFLQIKKYPSTFLGNYTFIFKFTCKDTENTSGLKCVGTEWVDINYVAPPVVENSNNNNIESNNQNNEKEIISDSKTDCSGCLLDDKCYSVGDLNMDKYCSQDGSFEILKQNSFKCENNYECVNGLCKLGTCREKTMFSKLMDWIAELF